MASLIGTADALILDEGDDAAKRELTLVMNNPAWMVVEELLDKSYLDVFAELLTDEAAGKSHKLTTTSAVLFGATRRNHPELTRDDCCDLIKDYGGRVLGPLGAAMRGSIRIDEPKDGEPMPGEAVAAETPPASESGSGKTS